MGAVGALLLGVKPILYLWSLRGYLRFFILFIDCICLFDVKCRMSGKVLLMYIAAACLVAALSESKVLFVEIILLILIYTLATFDFKRILKLIPPISIIIIISVFIMVRIYPYIVGNPGVYIAKQFWVAHHDNHDSLSRSRQITGLIEPIVSYAKSVCPSAFGPDAVPSPV